jgi:hypothetical protein
MRLARQFVCVRQAVMWRTPTSGLVSNCPGERPIEERQRRSKRDAEPGRRELLREPVVGRRRLDPRLEAGAAAREQQGLSAVLRRRADPALTGEVCKSLWSSYRPRADEHEWILPHLCSFAVGSLLSGVLISTTGTDGATWILRIAFVAVAVATIWDPHIRGHRRETSLAFGGT